MFTRFNTSIKFHFLLFIPGLIGIYISTLGAKVAGIGWDTAYETNAYSDFKKVPSDIWLYDAYDQIPGLLEYYGFLLHQITEFLMFAFASNQIYSSENIDVFYWQAISNILLNFIASISVVYVTLKTSKSLVIGGIYFSLMHTSPFWLGMLHVNFKDVPIASGLTIISAGLVLGVSRNLGSFDKFLSTFFIALGAFLSLGVRAGSLPLILFLIIGSLLMYLLINKITGQYHFNYKFLILIAPISGFITAALLFFTNPLARNNLVRWLVHSSLSSAKFPHGVLNRVASGDYSSTDLPWFYIPAWFFAQLSEFNLLILLSALLFILYLLLQKKFFQLMQVYGIYLPFMIQGFIMPVFITLSGAVLYDAIRHVSFVVPAIFLLIAIAISHFIEMINYNRRLFYISFVFLFSIFFYGLLSTTIWFPYSYAYTNLIMNSKPSERNWDLDYWGVSSREGINTLISSHGAKEVAVVPSNDMGQPYGGIYYSQDLLKSKQPVGIYFYVRFQDSYAWNDDCEKKFEIRRAGHKLGEGGICFPVSP